MSPDLFVMTSVSSTIINDKHCIMTNVFMTIVFMTNTVASYIIDFHFKRDLIATLFPTTRA